MIKTLRNLKKNSKGATAIEYGLLAALISVAAIAGITTVGEKVSSTFTSVSTTPGFGGNAPAGQ